MGPGHSRENGLPAGPQYQHFWIDDPRDTLFDYENSLVSRFPGLSVRQPIFDEDAMAQALRHAIYSAVLNTDATATFMFLPVWGKQ
eukprot:1153940-Pelagomonas_calceolata.AAC.3